MMLWQPKDHAWTHGIWEIQLKIVEGEEWVQLVLRKLAIVTQPSFLSPVCQETSTACL
jgi:hypothetical protein